MTTYLIRHWIEVRKSILLFYSMTVIFVATIDTFSPLSTDSSIFIVMVTGLLLLGLLLSPGLPRQHNTPISTGAFLSISVPLLFSVVISGTFANFMPKQNPVWPDPVPYFKSIVQGTEGTVPELATGSRRVVMVTDDSLLGGSFVQDDTLFSKRKWQTSNIGKSKRKTRIRQKDGNSCPRITARQVIDPGMEIAEHIQRDDEETPLHADLRVSLDFPFIVYPYGMQKVDAEGNVVFLHSESTGKYRTEINGRSDSLSAYEIEFVEPDYSLKSLRETQMQDYRTLDESFSQYLQLPDELPERVRELAESITEKQDSVYEKAKAIERYFGRNGFVYAQQDIAVPEADEDYVDQFLFDTKRGYCDNYSTSMVVMLRAVDIPCTLGKRICPRRISTG